MAREAIETHYPALPHATLVADGGGENSAREVTEYLADHPPTFTKRIALRDIIYSNSHAEAVNKIMKRYIRLHGPRTLPQLEACVAAAVHDYNCLRPHGSLNGLLPIEAYTSNVPPMDFTRQIARARAERIAQNREAGCGRC